MGDPVFVVDNASFSYAGAIPALHNVNLRVFSGEKLVLMGANGTGKSTLLLMLDGLIVASGGSVSAFGTRLTESVLSDGEFSRSFRRRVGLVFQNPDVQLFCPTVREDILFGPLQFGVSRDEARERLHRYAALLGIEDLLDRSPHQLSVGEKRKAAIASTLVIEPEVLLLDEPTAGLDPATTRHIVDIILEASARGVTVVTATHDLHIVEEIADCVCVMSRGKTVAACRPAQELMRDSVFLQEHNLIHVHRHRHRDTVHSHPHEHLDHHH